MTRNRRHTNGDPSGNRRRCIQPEGKECKKRTGVQEWKKRGAWDNPVNNTKPGGYQRPPSLSPLVEVGSHRSSLYLLAHPLGFPVQRFSRVGLDCRQPRGGYPKAFWKKYKAGGTGTNATPLNIRHKELTKNGKSQEKTRDWLILQIYNIFREEETFGSKKSQGDLYRTDPGKKKTILSKAEWRG